MKGKINVLGSLLEYFKWSFVGILNIDEINALLLCCTWKHQNEQNHKTIADENEMLFEC